MTHAKESRAYRLPVSASPLGSTLDNLKRIASTGNLRAAAALVFAGAACLWTCILQRATGHRTLRRRQVLLLTCSTSHARPLRPRAVDFH